MTPNAIEIHDLHRSFGTVRAVDGLDLTIGKGESVAVLGPNGAGKSTTIAMLLGLLAPDAGSVAVWGMPPAEAVARGHIAAMLQEGGLMPGVKVAELVGFVRSLYPDPLPLDRVLEAAGLAPLAGRHVDKLSGGQTQRVRFALALAGNPSVLVLDEPTAGMDVESRRAFWTSMRAEAAAGRTVLFATHYLEEADDNADRIVVVNGGRVVADGPATEIKAAAGGRTIRFSLAGGPSAGLEALPGVTTVEVHGDSVLLRSADPDATLRALFMARDEVQDIEVTGAGLEEAFLTLTGQ